MTDYNLTHLKQLEAESIHIIREVAAEFDNPVMMYSIGKDSSVMLHLARKAFYPGKIPFPLLHVDTDWKFREMIEFRDRTAKKYGFDLLVHKNPEGLAMGINPFEHGSSKHTDIMKTQGLKQALNKYGFDAAFGGARRDEDGDYWITGRVDDVPNVSGHRLGTAEIESALVAHEAIAEAAVVGYPHDLKGQGIYVYVIPYDGIELSEELTQQVRDWVAQDLSPIAKPDLIQWTDGLPKTRSGKIMRRILRKIAENDFGALGDTSTLADPSLVDRLIEGRQNR